MRTIGAGWHQGAEWRRGRKKRTPAGLLCGPVPRSQPPIVAAPVIRGEFSPDQKLASRFARKLHGSEAFGSIRSFIPRKRAMPGVKTQTRCCIVGGGPAGMMLGLLLARAGVAVTVLEKHGDFLRDFRGDTVHPSTLSILDEIGLRERFDQLP
ncbi:MAG: FAD-dependent monooxygenase, partial [Xanthomonadaceae bacterium]|nr:FAD-dependent monooxygenase [Xanthomonadaceae bacterium]